MKNKVIGICEGSKYVNYKDWLCGRGIEIIKLGYKQNNLNDVEKCDGILLTGGDDVNPELYNHPPLLKYDNAENIDKQRDEFEWKIMQHVEENQKPLLAICRGLQFVNVFYGGTLIPDIPASRKIKHSKYENGKDREHAVTVDTRSILYKITGKEKGMINSGHHQCTGIPAPGLMVSAMSPDGIIEGLEKKDAAGKSFFLLIQWHPERMEDTASAFSKNIKQSFLHSVLYSK